MDYLKSEGRKKKMLSNPNVSEAVRRADPSKGPFWLTPQGELLPSEKLIRRELLTSMSVVNRGRLLDLPIFREETRAGKPIDDLVIEMTKDMPRDVFVSQVVKGGMADSMLPPTNKGVK
jgi:hypothetical protein